MSVKSSESIFYEYLFLKGERLTAASYLITNHIDDKEPIKWNIRQKHLELHAALHALYQTSVPLPQSDLSHLVLIAADIRSLINLAKISRLISAQNANLMIAEFDDLQKRITTRGEKSLFAGHAIPTHFLETVLEDTQSTEVSLAQNDSPTSFGSLSRPLAEVNLPVAQVSENQTPQSPEITSSSQSEKMSDIKGKGGNVFNKQIKTSTTQASSPQTQIQTQSPTTPKTTPSTSAGETRRKSTKVVKAKSERRDSILRLIKEQGEVSVRDVADRVTDCSEKTLQRELLALVSEGVLTKIGDRRWSRYSLAL